MSRPASRRAPGHPRQIRQKDNFTRALLRWYDRHRRRLPWRERPSPYRTWISEIMLQQTQVATVLPYYDRFLGRFPDMQALAKAKEDDVLRLWSGLGYYSRARNLHRAAQEIVRDNNGKFPETMEGVLKLPGIGRYTAGAILSIAFGQPYPVLDGNVARVLTRICGLRGSIKSVGVQKKLWGLADKILDRKRPGDWNQALMELGALVCAPESPRCGECPISRTCIARKRGVQDEIPDTGKKKEPVELRWTCLWIKRNGSVLLWKRSDSERFLRGHWSLPELRHLEASAPGPKIKTVRHAITHHKISLDVHRAPAPAKVPPNARWTPLRQLRRYLVSSLWLKAVKGVS